jgi:hypothetical protein
VVGTKTKRLTSSRVEDGRVEGGCGDLSAEKQKRRNQEQTIFRGACLVPKIANKVGACICSFTQ